MAEPDSPGHEGLFLEEPAGLDAGQGRDRPVVDVGPRIAGAAVGKRYRKHLPEILRRLGKAFAAGFIHVELAQHRVDFAQAIKLAMDDLAVVIGEHEAGIVLHHVEPAVAMGFAEKVGVGREQPGHRMHVAAHEGAVDEEAVGICHSEIVMDCRWPSLRAAKATATSIRRHGEAYQAAFTSSLITTNFFNSIRPKLVVSATSAASRPVPINIRPMRGRLWRASKVY